MSVAPPPLDREAAEAWVEEHLGSILVDRVRGSRRFRGGQEAADLALERFDVAGYAARRNEVMPESRRGASGLSPWIRHGLLSLPRVWAAVSDGPHRDVAKFRDELMWQEYARHRYARLGRRAWSRGVATSSPSRDELQGRGMACLDAVWTELDTDGWLVNQTRMWAASHWTVRHGGSWISGEREMYRHLLDGSSAANGLGWQWTAGVATGKPYGFSRRQVERRAPGLCATCPLARSCPIEDWPAGDPPGRLDLGPLVRSDPAVDDTSGPLLPEVPASPEVVWLTAESMGDDDPAIAAHPDLPVVFVFDLPLLERLRLSSKRLVFLVETLADLGRRRRVDVLVGDPVEQLVGRSVATTFTPVPGWRSRVRSIDVAALYPWPWLRRPHDGSVASFSAWRRALG